MPNVASLCYDCKKSCKKDKYIDACRDYEKENKHQEVCKKCGNPLPKYRLMICDECYKKAMDEFPEQCDCKEPKQPKVDSDLDRILKSLSCSMCAQLCVNEEEYNRCSWKEKRDRIRNESKQAIKAWALQEALECEPNVGYIDPNCRAVSDDWKENLKEKFKGENK